MEDIDKKSDDLKKEVGRRIREIRKKAGFSNADSAAADLGVSATTLYELERGENWLSPEVAARIIEKWGVAINLFEETPKKAPPSPTVESLTRVIQDQENRLMEFAKIAAEPLIARVLKCSDDEKLELAKYLNMVEYSRKSAKASSKVSKKIE